MSSISFNSSSSSSSLAFYLAALAVLTFGLFSFSFSSFPLSFARSLFFGVFTGAATYSFLTDMADGGLGWMSFEGSFFISGVGSFGGARSFGGAGF